MSADETLFQMFVTKRHDSDREDRCFRKSVNHGLIQRDIFGQCGHCGLVNNLTKNKSVFCSECGSMVSDRHYKKIPNNQESVSIC